MPGNVPPVDDERAGLLDYLSQQRYVLRLSAFGLSGEQARATPTCSTLSIGGLLKHCAATEDGWIDIVLQRTSSPAEERFEDYVANFRLAEDETLADVLERYDAVAARTASVVAGIADLGHPVPVPKGVPWFPSEVDAWSLRWVLLHLIEETARHAGHADITRESVDGATASP